MMMGGESWRLALCVLVAVVACDDSDGDTGYGANQPVPSAVTCMDLCERAVDCTVQLCNENTDSTDFDLLFGDLLDECEATCSDASIQGSFTAAKWECFFSDTCREVMENDSCAVSAHYSCE